MIELLRSTEGHPRATRWLAIAITLLLGVANYRVGWEVSFSLLYLLPIAAISWLDGKGGAIAISTACAGFWALANVSTGFPATEVWVLWWNAGARFGFFLAMGILLVSLRSALDREAVLARTDPLTGVANGRAFQEMAELELARGRQTGQPFALAYIDLDDFKRINDELGHAAGDRLLRQVATFLLDRARPRDLVARLGGDEFALLLPETEADAAEAMLRAIGASLARAVAAEGHGIGFSAGAVVCPGRTADSLDAILHAADDLMYEAKRSRKGSVRVHRLGSGAERDTGRSGPLA